MTEINRGQRTAAAVLFESDLHDALMEQARMNGPLPEHPFVLNQHGAIDIAHERVRQQERYGYDARHDDVYVRDELIRAALAFLLSAVGWGSSDQPPVWWPWDTRFYKPKNRRADLVRAGALIAAEIDRLDRAERRASRTNTEHATLGPADYGSPRAG